MEHRLIQGGEQFLPFARSCVTKLKKLGLPYADQSYEVDGASIKVRIVPGHEYIRIDGGIRVLSGAIRGGSVETVGTGDDERTVVRSYRPTQNAWDYPLHKALDKSPATFGDEKSLVVTRAPKQYKDISPSMFSGLMAKVVAVVMGRGREITYASSWVKCHGVVLGSNNEPWLIEISDTEGVLAMRLPADKGGKNSKVDAERNIYDLIGGVPSGKTFPTDLADAINSKRVLRLATRASMEAYFSKLPYSRLMGWSFNDSGSEAHNTCFTLVSGVATGFHYKLAISIVTDNGVTTGAAALSLVSSGIFCYRPATTSRFMFRDVGEDGVVFMTPPPNTAEGLDGQGDATGSSAPLVACHIDGVLDVVSYTCAPLHDSFSVINGGDVRSREVHNRTYSKDAGGNRAQYISSTTFPSGGGEANFYDAHNEPTFTRSGWWSDGFYANFIVCTTYYTRSTSYVTTAGLQSGVWAGARDAYVVYKAQGVAYTVNIFAPAGGYNETVVQASLETQSTGGHPGLIPAPDVSSRSVSVQQGTLVSDETLVIVAPGDPVANMAATGQGAVSLSTEGVTGWTNAYSKCVSGVFTIRHSAFGRPHHQVTSLADLAVCDLSGPLLEGETTPAETEVDYNFIGYT